MAKRFRQQLVRRIIATAGVFFLLARPPIASPVKLPHADIHVVLLDNGLRALLVEDRKAPVVSVQVWYHVGSRDEVAGKTGYAHILEHMMFQGTKNVGPEGFSEYIVHSGGLDNAYTTEDTTVYWETIPSAYLPVALWLEADRMRNLEMTERLVNIEKEVVKEERRSHFENQPYGTVVETLYQYAYTVHPYQHTTIGDMDDVSRARVADLRDFYDTYYVPNNATLVITGDLDWREAEAEVRKYFAPVAQGNRLPVDRKIPAEPPQTARRALTLHQSVALPAFVEGYHMPADGTPDAYPLRLAGKMLSDGESARVYRRLVYDKQIALEAQTTGNFTEDPNLFFVLAVMNPGHTPAEGESEVEAEIERLKSTTVSDAELTKAKHQILRDFILSRQTAQLRGEELGYAAVVLKDPELVNTELNRFLTVTAEDIRRVARKYFVPENMTLVEVYPQRQGQGSKPGAGN